MRILYRTETKCVLDYDEKNVLVKYYTGNCEPKVYDILKRNNVVSLNYAEIQSDCIKLEKIGRHIWYLWDETIVKSYEEEIFRTLGEWFRSLHRIKMSKNELELGVVNSIQRVTGGKDNSWIVRFNGLADIDVIYAMISCLRSFIKRHSLSLLHNDFCRKNTLIEKTSRRAIMFDYDKSGWGLAEQDILAVSQRVEGKRLDYFMEGYGEINRDSMVFADAIDNIETLYYASMYAVFPKWAKDAVWNLKTGLFERMLSQMLEVNE